VESGFSESGITRKGMDQLKQRLIKMGTVDRAELAGIKHDRSSVLPGGLAIMSAVFDELQIERMQTADGALRLGVLYDLLGRDASHDKRDDTVRQFMARYEVDVAQAMRVRKAALAIFARLVPGDAPGTEELIRMLAWTAELHEVGLSIAHAAFHKHTAYVLEHADMPGFSRQDQKLMALLALGHIGKLAKLQPLVRSQEQWMAILSLRLATLLFRRREDSDVLPISVSAQGSSIIVKADHDWLAAHPLTDFTLRSETSEWSKIGFSFELLEH